MSLLFIENLLDIIIDKHAHSPPSIKRGILYLIQPHLAAASNCQVQYDKKCLLEEASPIADIKLPFPITPTPSTDVIGPVGSVDRITFKFFLSDQGPTRQRRD
jgi:hypothetical protein